MYLKHREKCDTQDFQSIGDLIVYQTVLRGSNEREGLEPFKPRINTKGVPITYLESKPCIWKTFINFNMLQKVFFEKENMGQNIFGQDSSRSWSFKLAWKENRGRLALWFVSMFSRLPGSESDNIKFPLMLRMRRDIDMRSPLGSKFGFGKMTFRWIVA